MGFTKTRKTAKEAQPRAASPSGAPGVDANVYLSRDTCAQDLDETRKLDGPDAARLVAVLEAEFTRIETAVTEVEDLAAECSTARDALSNAQRELAAAQHLVEKVGTPDAAEGARRYMAMVSAAQACTFRKNELERLQAELAAAQRSAVRYIEDTDRRAALDLTLGLAQSVRQTYISRAAWGGLPAFRSDVDDRELVWWPLAEARAFAWLAADEQRFERVSEFGAGVRRESVPPEKLAEAFEARRSAVENHRAQEIAKARAVLAKAEQRVGGAA